MNRYAVALSLVGAIALGCGGTEAPSGKQILWYGPSVHPFFQESRKGVDAFVRDSGVPVEVSFGQEMSQDNENQNIEAFAASGFDGFAIQPCDVSAANGLYEQLTQAGMIVVGYGTPTLNPTTASMCIGTDVKQAAMDATEALIQFMGEEGNILNVLEMVEDPNTVLRKQGIEEVVAKYPNVRIFQEISDMKTIEESTSKIEDALATNIGEIDGIVTTGYTPTVAAAMILSEWHGKEGHARVRFVGIDTDEVVLNAIRVGDIDATIAQNPLGMGYLSCLLVSHLLDGWTRRLGYQVIDAGTVLVTAENVDTFAKDVQTVTDRIHQDIETKYLSPPE